MSSQSLAVVPQFSQEQIDIIRSQVAPKGTTNDELAMFMQYCQRTGLDPFARQIYLSERRSQVNGQWVVTRKPETTVDGFRVSAERNGHYAGQLGPFWCGEDGEWKDVWVSERPPLAARVAVLRHDFKEPLWAVALYEEYLQTKADGQPNQMWKKMPANQLAKCAESLALRRAFPRELSGLYTREEMPTEQHEAKEAQRDYLASKGLEPYNAPPKGLQNARVAPGDAHDIRTASEAHNALIVETAKMLDDPPQPDNRTMDNSRPSTKTIEMRHAKTVAEADAAISEVAKPEKRKRGSISFDALKKWGELKKQLREATGDDSIYYGTLKAKGYQHADEINNPADATSMWKVLGAELNRIKQENELVATLGHASEVLGQRVFSDLLGTYGAETIPDVLKMGGDALAELLKAMKYCIDAKNGGNAA